MERSLKHALLGPAARILVIEDNSSDVFLLDFWPLRDNYDSCDVHRHVLFIDGNGDCYGCYNPFRAVNGLPIDKDPFFFGNLFTQSFEQITGARKRFNPVIDVSKPYWRPCLLCKAVPAVG